MKLQTRLEEESISSAKQHGHGDVLPVHVAVVVFDHFKEPNGPVPAAVAHDAVDQLPTAGNAINQPTVSDSAREFINKCSTPESALAAACELLGVDVPRPEAQTIYPTAEVAKSPSSAPRANDESQQQREEILAEAYADLDALVGLATVKKRVRELAAVQEFNRVRGQEGLPALNTGLHLVFTGDPGTGKTTVARIIARIYQGLGLLPTGQLIEVDRSELVGEYVGHTAQKTTDALRRARGGVLFIDEAYALAGVGGNDFGSEAIATIVKSMEDHRGDTAVIAAGYADKMKLFIESNPGLRSRFQTFIRFPNYSNPELLQIFRNLTETNKVNCSEAVLAEVAKVINASSTAATGGNARFVRSLFEAMTTRMALRAAADGQVESHEVTDFAAEDIPPAAVLSEPRTGFGQ